MKLSFLNFEPTTFYTENIIFITKSNADSLYCLHIIWMQIPNTNWTGGVVFGPNKIEV